MFIETANGKYEIKKPGGKLGTKNMILLAQLATVEGLKTVPEEGVEDPALIELIKADNARLSMAKMSEVFEQWAPQMLPAIVVSGPYTYDDMPGEDQLAIFLAVNQESVIGDELFRVVPATPT